MVKNCEYLLPAGNSGVLLIHGLTGTPTEMRFVANGLWKAGFTVLGMQLAGHCGDAGDLLATGWEDWYRSVDEAATRLQKQVEHLFVAGLSMGAVLALALAADRPKAVRGLGLYGTTFRYDGWAVPRMARLSFLLPLACAIGLGRERAFMETYPYGIKSERIRSWITGRMLAGDSAAGGLPGNPWPSLAQFHLLARSVRKRLDEVRAPCLAVHSADDDIAGASNVELLRRRLGGPVETVWLRDSYHMITVDQERDAVIDASARFFSRLAPASLRAPAA